jgi:hypothetical protein
MRAGGAKPTLPGVAREETGIVPRRVECLHGWPRSATIAHGNLACDLD